MVLSGRNPKLIVAGLCCLLVGAAGLWLAWSGANATTPVLVMARDVAIGQPITNDDVAAVSVRLGPGVAALPPDHPLAGQVALIDLPAGTLLVAGAIGTLDAGPPGTVRMAVVVSAGMAPVEVLGVGVPVTLCGPDGQLVSGTIASPPATLPDTSRHRFDVWVSLDDAPYLAMWVADETLVVTSP